MAVLPFEAGKAMPSMLSVSPSASLSLASTSISTAVSKATLALSLTATGAVLTGASLAAISPDAEAVPIVPALRPESVTVKPSAGSCAASSKTGMSMRMVSGPPAVKLTLPEGSAPPAKSAPLAAFGPDPLTAKPTMTATWLAPLRVTANWAVPPSATAAVTAAIETSGVFAVWSPAAMV